MSVDQYAVVGNPIKHSKSPHIHKAFAMQTDEDISYTSILAPEDDFVGTVRAFFQNGGKGMNVTVPFKQQAYELVDELSDRAQRAKAVNTLILREDGRLRGDNTDGVGMVRDIVHNHDGRLANKKILILGAGGAVRGVLAPLLAENPALVVVANRTLEKAVHLVEEFQDLGRIEAQPYSKLNQAFDWVINGTSASLAGELPPLPSGLFAAHSRAYDMMYGKEQTPFNGWSLQQGAEKAYDGLGMLVEQAAESFRMWRGVMPTTASVIADLRSA